jgi:hypothetical protein
VSASEIEFAAIAGHPFIVAHSHAAAVSTRRRIVILALLTVGFMFSLTGAVVGISRLRKTLPIDGRR